MALAEPGEPGGALPVDGHRGVQRAGCAAVPGNLDVDGGRIGDGWQQGTAVPVMACHEVHNKVRIGVGRVCGVGKQHGRDARGQGLVAHPGRVAG